MLKVSAGALAGSAVTAVGSPASSLAGTGTRGRPGSGGDDPAGILRIAPPKLNASTGGSPLTPAVRRALQTQTVPVNDPAFVDVFTRTTQLAAELLKTKQDVLLIPAEAIVALEAAFRSVTRPGLTALNLISGVYGEGYTTWLKTYGATVIEIRVPYDQAIDPASVEAALAAHPEVELLTVVHVDTPSSTTNPVEQICKIAKQHGVVSLVDAASTIGGMPFYPDEWGIDIGIGASQKAIGSPLGVGITSVSDAAWALIAKNPDPPEDFSFLSLAQWKNIWVEQGRVPSTVSPTITFGLYAALDRLLKRGVLEAFSTTQRAARAFRAGARAMGIQPWAPDAIASDTSTTLVLPANVTVASAVTLLRQRYGVVSAGTKFTGSPSAETIRVGHMGPVQTDPQFVLRLLRAVGLAWRNLGADVDVRAGLQAAREVLHSS